MKIVLKQGAFIVLISSEIQEHQLNKPCARARRGLSIIPMAERRSRSDYSVSRGNFTSEDDASDEKGGDGKRWTSRSCCRPPGHSGGNRNIKGFRIRNHRILNPLGLHEGQCCCFGTAELKLFRPLLSVFNVILTFLSTRKRRNHQSAGIH